jgi:hypothetical protein
MDKPKKHTPFQLPQDYFSVTTCNIRERLLLEEERKTYLFLNRISESGFAVSDNYFNKTIRETELIPYPSLKTSQASQEMIFGMPPDYFKVGAQILKEALAENTHASGCTVSESYFENSRQQITKELNKRQSATVLYLFHRKTVYAAAALLVIALGIWLFKFRETTTEVLTKDCNTLACIEKRELLKFKLQHLETDELYELVNPDDLEKKLIKGRNNSDAVSAHNNSVQNEIMDYLE